MSDYEQARSYEYVTLVDKAAKGGVEIIHDGHRTVFAKGEVEKIVPQFLARWLFTVDQQKVHTTDGRFIHRFAIKDPSEELLGLLGPEVGDQTPIEIDTNRVEGWDVDRYAPDRGRVEVVPVIGRSASDYANVASAGGSGFSRER